MQQITNHTRLVLMYEIEIHKVHDGECSGTFISFFDIEVTGLAYTLASTGNVTKYLCMDSFRSGQI